MHDDGGAVSVQLRRKMAAASPSKNAPKAAAAAATEPVARPTYTFAELERAVAEDRRNEAKAQRAAIDAAIAERRAEYDRAIAMFQTAWERRLDDELTRQRRAHLAELAALREQHARELAASAQRVEEWRTLAATLRTDVERSRRECTHIHRCISEHGGMRPHFSVKKRARRGDGMTAADDLCLLLKTYDGVMLSRERALVRLVVNHTLSLNDAGRAELAAFGDEGVIEHALEAYIDAKCEADATLRRSMQRYRQSFFFEKTPYDADVDYEDVVRFVSLAATAIDAVAVEIAAATTPESKTVSVHLADSNERMPLRTIVETLRTHYAQRLRVVGATAYDVDDHGNATASLGNELVDTVFLEEFRVVFELRPPKRERE
jgi:hypothetical protein